MTKKNIRPQQVAPVQRETTAISKDQSGQIKPQKAINGPEQYMDPFAGEDAE